MSSTHNGSSKCLVARGVYLLSFCYQAQQGLPMIREVSGDRMADDLMPLVEHCIRDHRLFSYRETLELLAR